MRMENMATADFIRFSVAASFVSPSLHRPYASLRFSRSGSGVRSFSRNMSVSVSLSPMYRARCSPSFAFACSHSVCRSAISVRLLKCLSFTYTGPTHIHTLQTPGTPATTNAEWGIVFGAATNATPNPCACVWIRDPSAGRD